MNETRVGEYVEQLIFDDATWDLTGGLALTGDSSANSIYGTAYGDVMNGAGASDTLYGNAGNDTLIGDLGNDQLYGGQGNDTYVLNTAFGQDTISETAGTDMIQFETGIALEDLRFWRSSSSSTSLEIYVGASDRITLSNHLYDQHNGTNNHDEVETLRFADNSTFNLMGSLTFTGTSAGQSVYGTKGNDTLLGLGGNDTLNGYEGGDVLIGGAGADVLYGGSGADTFLFSAETFGSIDAIADLSLANGDKIDLSDVLQGYDPLTDAITDFVGFTTSGANSILKVDADGGANNFVQIATLTGVTGLTDEAALVTSGHLIAA
jgi:Ca2+-binding RTX toxin-like protein